MAAILAAGLLAQERRGSCDFLRARLSAHCEGGSGWACNEVSVLETRRAPTEDPANKLAMADVVALLERGCALGFHPACDNVLRMLKGSGPETAPPAVDDYPIILRGSKREVSARSPAALLSMACGQGWPGACGRAEQVSSTQ